MNFLPHLKWLLLPFALVYSVVLGVRHFLYNRGILSSQKFDKPIICVGNLSFGGTGKTPMIEYLTELLEQMATIAIVSRGYGRKTKGFLLANPTSTSEDIGDEPCQYVNKFTKIFVAVDASRVRAIENLPPVDVILLDDALQHRAVKAGLNILLTTYNNLYAHDKLFPMGTLRDTKNQAKRADIIVVTKCPRNLPLQNRLEIAKSLRPQPRQALYFSAINYSYWLYDGASKMPLKELNAKKFTLVTGIANSLPLVEFLRNEKFDFEHLNFRDHHHFLKKEIIMLNQKELIVTTEKDFSRLKNKVQCPMYYIPITMSFLNNGENFDKSLLNFVKPLK